MIKYFLACLLTAYVSLGVLLDSEPIKGWIKEQIISQVEQETGIKISFEHFRVYPTFRATFENIIIDDLQVDKLNTGLNLFDLFKKKLTFYKIEVIGANSPYFKNLDFTASLSFDTKSNDLAAHFFHKKGRGSVSYLKGNGILSCSNEQGGKATLHFTINNDRIMIPFFEAFQEPFSIQGSLALLKNGFMEDSAFILKADLFGGLAGQGSLKGHITSPEIDAILACPCLELHGFKFDQPKIRFLSKPLDSGLEGIATLSFYKDELFHTFSGKMNWENGNIKNPSNIKMQVKLKELAQIASFDQGIVNGDLNIQLHINNKTIEMAANLMDGSIELNDPNLIFTSIQGMAVGNLEGIILKELKAKDQAGGSYEATGSLQWQNELPFTLDLSMNKGSLIQNDIFQGIFDGKFQLTGNMKEGYLKGNLKTVAARVVIPEERPDRPHTVEVAYINLPEGESPPVSFEKVSIWPLSLDIKVNVNESGHINGKNLTSEWKGKATIKGTPEHPKVSGEFKLKEGKYLFRGRSVKLKEGRILFAGDPVKQSNLYLTASLDLGDIDIHAVVKGALLNPNITLTSTPSMPQRSILSWLLFNKGVSDINSMEETQLTRSIRNLAEQTDDKPDILTRVGGILGLDRVEIGSGPNENGEVTLKVGKYLTEDTFISISSSLTQDENGSDRSNSVSIEKQFGKHVRFRAEADSEANGRVNLLWRNDY